MEHRIGLRQDNQQGVPYVESFDVVPKEIVVTKLVNRVGIDLQLSRRGQRGGQQKRQGGSPTDDSGKR